ncbi:MAG: AraD1 family protein [Pseudomonadota bacterium]
MKLIQYIDENGDRAVAARRGTGDLKGVEGVKTVYDLALLAITEGCSLTEVTETRLSKDVGDILDLLAQKRILPPTDHTDPRAHWLTGTGFTHMVPSAQAAQRNNPPTANELATMAPAAQLIAKGVLEGKPEPGAVGLQPEWFYKGDGRGLTMPEGPLMCPAFGQDGSEEAEVVAHYIIDKTGTPHRMGFTLGNEFTDHAMDGENAYYLSHAKIRPCSFGPELLLGPLPSNVEGRTRIFRGDDVIFEAPFWCGEDNMTHSLDNLEHHHFKYDLFRQPGDIHSHFLGTTTMSYQKGVRLEAGDLIELESEVFGAPLRNKVTASPKAAVTVETL